MKKYLSILLLLTLVLSAGADLNIFTEVGKDPKLPKSAKDPVSGEIVKVELEEGYVYDRTLASYNRTEGTFDHGWGFRTKVHYGELWQYKWQSHVLYAGDNYVVEYLNFSGNKAASSKIIVESKRELKTALSSCLQDVMQSNSTNEMFGNVGRALFQSEFKGLKIKQHEDGETLMNRNDDVRAFRESFGFHGKQYIVIHELNEGNDPQIRRVAWEGLELGLWSSPSADDNKRNRTQIEMLKNAILSLDRSLVPGDTVYKPGVSWTIKAKNLRRFITPYTRVDKSDGELKFKTDEKPRPFNGEKFLKIYTTSKGDDARLVVVKQLSREDKTSRNQWDHWHGELALDVDEFKAFIKPEGKNSFIHYLYSKSSTKGDGAKSVPWLADPKVKSEIDGESLYYCTRAKKKDKALRAQGLKVAQSVFEKTFGHGGEDYPWKRGALRLWW